MKKNKKVQLAEFMYREGTFNMFGQPATVAVYMSKKVHPSQMQQISIIGINSALSVCDDELIAMN